MVQPCHSLVPQQLFADPCSMLENTEQDSKSCCASSATRPRFDIDTNRRIASAPLRFNLLTRLMNKPPGSPMAPNYTLIRANSSTSRSYMRPAVTNRYASLCEG